MSIENRLRTLERRTGASRLAPIPGLCPPCRDRQHLMIDLTAGEEPPEACEVCNEPPSSVIAIHDPRVSPVEMNAGTVLWLPAKEPLNAA